MKVPLYGCDCYAYALLASGYVDLVIESGLKVTCACIYNVDRTDVSFFFLLEIGALRPTKLNEEPWTQ